MPARHSLPVTPDLDVLRREAKALLRDLRAGDPAALLRARTVAPDLPAQLSTAQLVLAREYGVDSWPQLKALIDRVVEHGIRYDVIGRGYAAYRRPDPRIASRILAALGDARTVLNVGAGTGSYEPTDRPVLALEPSTEMAEQRPPHLPPAVRGVAESLPLADDSVDATMGVLTLHHWSDQARGLAEVRRVTRRRVVLVTIDPQVQAGMWLFADYLPQIATAEFATMPTAERIADWLGAPVVSEVVPVPADCTDGMGLAFWSRPEAVLDDRARAATSGFARLDDAVEAAAVSRLAADLASGAWDARHAHLRELTEADVGLRLLVAELG